LGYHVTDGFRCCVVVAMLFGGCDAVRCINGADLRRRVDDAFKNVGGLHVRDPAGDVVVLGTGAGVAELVRARTRR
jgi:hypothetical protein